MHIEPFDEGLLLHSVFCQCVHRTPNVFLRIPTNSEVFGVALWDVCFLVRVFRLGSQAHLSQIGTASYN